MNKPRRKELERGLVMRPMRPRYKVRYRPPNSEYEFNKYFNDFISAQQFKIESGGTLYELQTYTQNSMTYFQWKGL